MDKGFYAVLKLNTGDEVLSWVEQMDNKKFLTLSNPIVVQNINIPGLVSGMKIDRWMKISNQDTFVVNINHIITITEMDLPIQLFYTKSLQQLIYQENFHTQQGSSPAESKDDLDSIRSKLEDLFNNT